MQQFRSPAFGIPACDQRHSYSNAHEATCKEFFCPSDEKAILVLDGTYIYVQKSTDFAFQRRSFSMQKHRHLVKPMMIVSTTGYTVAAIGPYLADGKILNHIFATNVQEIKLGLRYSILKGLISYLNAVNLVCNFERVYFR